MFDAHFLITNLIILLFNNSFCIGEVMAYWKEVFQETKKLIPLYGTTPNKATFDPEYRDKR